MCRPILLAWNALILLLNLLLLSTRASELRSSGDNGRHCLYEPEEIQNIPLQSQHKEETETVLVSDKTFTYSGLFTYIQI